MENTLITPRSRTVTPKLGGKGRQAQPLVSTKTMRVNRSIVDSGGTRTRPVPAV
jgi:hypothetical protein